MIKNLLSISPAFAMLGGGRLKNGKAPNKKVRSSQGDRLEIFTGIFYTLTPQRHAESLVGSNNAPSINKKAYVEIALPNDLNHKFYRRGRAWRNQALSKRQQQYLNKDNGREPTNYFMTTWQPHKSKCFLTCIRENFGFKY